MEIVIAIIGLLTVAGQIYLRYLDGAKERAKEDAINELHEAVATDNLDSLAVIVGRLPATDGGGA